MTAVRLEREHAFDDGVGVRAVADEVAEDQRVREAARGGVGEARVERFEVRVDVGQDEITHAG